MIIVSPIAAIAVRENARATPSRLSVDRKTGERIARNALRTSKAIRMFSSLMRVSQPTMEPGRPRAAGPAAGTGGLC